MTLPDEAAALFRVEPKGFVAARNELAAGLAADGRGDDAATVKALRKPTVVVWAIDQLADRDADGVGALLDSGRELRAAQQATLSSKGGSERLRSATVARREIVARLTKVAIAALDEVGTAGRTQADAITAALEVASVDDEAAGRLAAGTLESIPDASDGFADVFGLTSVEGTAPAKGRAPKAAKKPDLTRLRRDRDAAAKAARTSRDKAERIARELATARERVETLEAAHAEAEARAGADALETKRAERALTKAERG